LDLSTKTCLDPIFEPFDFTFLFPRCVILKAESLCIASGLVFADEHEVQDDTFLWIAFVALMLPEIGSLGPLFVLLGHGKRRSLKR
jgi:hypothetical protein